MDESAPKKLGQLIEDENLNPDETRNFESPSFREGSVRTTGTAITKVLPPVARFSAEGGHGKKKARVLAKLGAFFERFSGLSSGGDE